MKRLLLISVITCIINYAFSQSKESCISGVYLTENDFIHNRLSFALNTGEEGNKLEFSFPADLTLAVKLITPDTTFKFEAGSIYGFNDCGKVFRYFHGGEELNAQEDYYRLLEMEGLIIYSSAFVSDEELFYSLEPASPIHRLTMNNLEHDFKGQLKFLDAARKLNREPGAGLATQDKDGRFSINRIYRETIYKETPDDH